MNLFSKCQQNSFFFSSLSFHTSVYKNRSITVKSYSMKSRSFKLEIWSHNTTSFREIELIHVFQKYRFRELYDRNIAMDSRTNQHRIYIWWETFHLKCVSCFYSIPANSWKLWIKIELIITKIKRKFIIWIICITIPSRNNVGLRYCYRSI